MSRRDFRGESGPVVIRIMKYVILLLILIESLLALKDSMNQERSHRFY